MPPETNQLTSDIIGACMAVHRELGPGLLEVLYQRAVCVELEWRGITHEVERAIPIFFRNQIIGHHRLDLVVDNQVVVELKAVERIGPQHVAQPISYLRVSRMRVALLVNFNVPILKDGIRRVVL
ncbi:MAG TPA: GxxExxY protein [Vicinamibacterales bacterium]|nr:GxxExxY protein [Vicinamibacterales bacterium]